jgi:L-ascorbate metabolism protein UlaG (beta-lactamase superfamily)
MLKDKKCESLKSFFLGDDDGLYYLSHASILAKLSGKNFLFDPVLAKPPHLGSWLFYPEMKIDACLLDVDAVFISHQHQDHFDVDFLKQLPEKTEIYIVAGRPQFSKMLKNEGIVYIEIPENQIFELGGGVTCIGVTHEYNGIDSAITISNGKFTIYHGNDCFLSSEKLKIVKALYPKVDVACIPFAYVHWYPFLLDDVSEAWRTQESDRLIKKYLDYGLTQIEDLEPSIAIPFGANMFYFDDVDSYHNKAVVSPLDFEEYAAQVNFKMHKVIKPLFAGDSIVSGSQLTGMVPKIYSAGIEKKSLMEGLRSYIEYIRIIGTGFDEQSIEKIKFSEITDVNFIEDRLANNCLGKLHNVYISNIDHLEIDFIEINLKSGRCNFAKKINESLPYHWFKLTDLAYKAYLSKKFSFNEIVASSRFRLTRVPNSYDIEILKIINNVL